MKDLKVTPKEEVAFINHELDAYQAKADMASAQGNETQRTLAEQLILIAATVITVSAALVTTGTVSLGQHSKWFLIICWIAFSLSISFGLLGLVLDARYFLSWQRFFMAVGKRLGSGNYNPKNIKEVKIGLTIPKDVSPIWPLYLQIIFLGLGGLFFLGLIVHLVLILP